MRTRRIHGTLCERFIIKQVTPITLKPFECSFYIIEITVESSYFIFFLNYSVLSTFAMV